AASDVAHLVGCLDRPSRRGRSPRRPGGRPGCGPPARPRGDHRRGAGSRRHRRGLRRRPVRPGPRADALPGPVRLRPRGRDLPPLPPGHRRPGRRRGALQLDPGGGRGHRPPRRRSWRHGSGRGDHDPRHRGHPRARRCHLLRGRRRPHGPRRRRGAGRRPGHAAADRGRAPPDGGGHGHGHTVRRVGSL
ncbi:MAG: hypothetical protein AVDCRST_MAG49-1208, partial [uncultured Thermomicrobiales bacterium]